MTKEIERRWLCDGWPADLQHTHDWSVDQAYLYVNDDIEVRIHSKVDNQGLTETYYCLTVKTGQGLERVELKTHLTKQEYDEFMSEVKGEPLKKHFRTYDLYGHELCVSFVDNSFFYAEIEFDTRKQAREFSLPYAWKEVTDNTYYNMKNYWARAHAIN